LDRAIEILVIERVFIVPDPRRRVTHFVAHKPNAIVMRIRLNLIHGRATPRHDGRLLSHSGTNGGKCEGCRPATHVIPLVGSIVVHVALARVALAPGVFVWNDVFRFGKIGRAWILSGKQIIRFHQNSM